MRRYGTMKLLPVILMLLANLVYANQCVMQKSETCIEGAETRYFSGIPFYKQCWAYEATYACLTEQNNQNECQVLRNQSCTQSKSVCVETNQDGVCTQYDNTYQCPVNDAREVQQTICTESYCADGSCSDQSTENDGSFAKSVAMMEAGREAGHYGIESGNINVFAGAQNKCTVKVAMGGTVKSCCLVESGGEKFTNQARNGGSAYTYDDLYEEDKLQATLEGVLTGGWLTCTDKEKALSLERGQNLCEYVNEECTDRIDVGFASTCIEKTRTYCCFKSKLAKAINTQGKEQLNLNRKDCTGFNQDQLEQIDFSQINLDEFIDSIVPKSLDLEQKKSSISNKTSSITSVSDFYE